MTPEESIGNVRLFLEFLSFAGYSNPVLLVALTDSANCMGVPLTGESLDAVLQDFREWLEED